MSETREPYTKTPAASQELEHFHLQVDADGIAWLHFDRADAGANTLSSATLAAFEQYLTKVDAIAPRGLVIRSDKPGFIAGADVHEIADLDSEHRAYDLISRTHAIFDRLAALPYPTVALIQGYCLGGGVELALACRYRVARDDPDTILGLPEVRLGIHPGFGGSVRLPALIGHIRAMDLMLSGRSLDARAAARIGLVDHAVPERNLEQATRWLVLNDPGPHRASRLQRLPGRRPLRPLLAGYLRRRVKRRARPDHYPAPYALIDLWARHGASPETQLQAEAQSVARLAMDDTAHNLMRAFLLREQLKQTGRDTGFDINHVHVIGAGTMGGDIAAWCALRGLNVSLQDQSAALIAPAVKRAADLFGKRLRDRHRITAALDRLQPDPAGAGVTRADIVIEAVSENSTAKQRLYAAVEPRMRADALLATNTSSIPLEALGTCLIRPGRLVGLHFFNPVSKMQLVEVVRGAATEQESVDRAAAFTRRIDRLPLPVTSTPGFLVNRVLTPYLLEAVTLLEEGVPAAAIDTAAADFGMPMGPIELGDAVGLDICLAVAQILAEHAGGEVPEALRQRVAAGQLGRKSGRGFYRYIRGRPDRRRFPWRREVPANLQDRLMLRLLNEAVRCLREGVVTDADRLDAGLIFGAGFAPFRGGPVHYIRHAGPAALRERLDALARQYGERFRPDPGWEVVQP